MRKMIRKKRKNKNNRVRHLKNIQVERPTVVSDQVAQQSERMAEGGTESPSWSSRIQCRYQPTFTKKGIKQNIQENVFLMIPSIIKYDTEKDANRLNLVNI